MTSDLIYYVNALDAFYPIIKLLSFALDLFYVVNVLDTF